MILEGIVTTTGPTGAMHLAPMGPHVPSSGVDWTKLRLRPFQTSQTYQNLVKRPEGVFHVIDDVLLLAQAAVGQFESPPPHQKSHHVEGWILQEACRYYEFRITSQDHDKPRADLEAQVVYQGRLRDFQGFNRAKHAVVEAAILVTRLHILDHETVQAEMDRLMVMIEKTGGEQEREAFALIQKRVKQSGGKP